MLSFAKFNLVWDNEASSEDDQAHYVVMVNQVSSNCLVSQLKILGYNPNAVVTILERDASLATKTFLLELYLQVDSIPYMHINCMDTKINTAE